MRYRALLGLAVALMFGASASAAGTKVTLDAAGNTVINGTPTFQISLGFAPPPGAKTESGKDGLEEVHEGGVTCFRIPPPEKWNDAGLAMIQSWLDAGEKHGMYGWISLRDLDKIPSDDSPLVAKLRGVVNRFKDHQALIAWKGKDEPAWGVHPVPPDQVIRVYKIIKAADPDHPVNIGHAPKRDWQTRVPYMAGCDITGEDIFPVGYPPGKHSDLPNKGLSVVGDETQRIAKAAGGKPIWMALQIAWSGVAKPGRTIRFPTFADERYMTYEVIINGARGLNYFGGNVEQVMTPEDKALHWNWHFWNRVLKYVLEEINEKSPLHPALIAPNSKRPVKVEGANDVEFVVREAGNDLFIIASKREGDTVQAKFTGLPADLGDGEVLYESPRMVKAVNGEFTDWFGPNEVHVYRFHRSNG